MFFSITFTPQKNVLMELDKQLGWNFSQNCLLKIRLYGRLFDKKRKTYWCKILPIAAMEPVPCKIIETLFEKVLKVNFVTEQEFKEFFNASHLDSNEKKDAELNSKLRFISFLIASYLKKIWFSQVNKEILTATHLFQDEKNISYLFPPRLIKTIKRLSEINEPIFTSVPNYYRTLEANEYENSTCSQEQYIDEYTLQNKLMDPFIKLFEGKELKARDLVCKHGKGVFDLQEWKNIINRLNIGFSLPEMRAWIDEYSTINVEKLLSLFLDWAIDHGYIVPITCKQNGLIYRAYRHGEDVEFGQSQERMCVLMLESLRNASKIEALPHTLVEKALVILIRIGIQQHFFNYWGGKLGDFQSVGIRFSMHGAVVTTGSDKLYFTTDHHSLTAIMEDHNYISRKTKDEPWKILKIPQSGFHPDGENKAILVGSLIGELYTSTPDLNTHISTDDMTIIASCLYPKDAIGALAAQIHNGACDIHYSCLTEKYLSSLSIDELYEFITKFRKRKIFFSAHNGFWKFRKFLSRDAWEIIERVSKSLDNPIYKATWDSFWPSEGRQGEVAIPDNLKTLLVREGFWLFNLKALCFMFEVALRYDHARQLEDLFEQEKKFKEVKVLLNREINNFEDLNTIYFPDNKKTISLINSFRDKIISKKIHVQKFYKFVGNEFKYLLNESKDILSEVDCLATNIGEPEKISYYNHVLHIDLLPYNKEPGDILKKCLRLFYEFRGRARTKDSRTMTILSEIPKEQTPIPSGLWICASGSMARVWLERLALSVIKELEDQSIIRCVLFPNLSPVGNLRKPNGSSEYVGPNFWSLVDCLFNDILGVCRLTELICVVDKYTGDLSGVDKELLREGKEIIRNSYEDTKEIEKPIQKTILISHYGSIKTSNINKNKRENIMDVGILTILADETKAVIDFLKKHPNYKEEQGKMSKRFYYKGEIPALAVKSHQVVCTRALKQGNRSIMSAYQDLSMEYRPKLIILLGIGGSIHKDADICDTVIAEEIYYYDKRAEAPDGTNRRLVSYNIEPWLLNEINRLFNEYGDTPEFDSWEGSCKEKFKLLFGPIGTGEAVIKHRDAKEREWLAKVNDKTLALDTEASGVAQQFSEDQIRNGYKPEGYLIIRGISDHADKEKNDNWRVAATGNAMLTLQHLLKKISLS